MLTSNECRIPRTTRSTSEVPGGFAPRVEHLSFPLSKSWCRSAKYLDFDFSVRFNDSLDLGKVLAGIQVPPSDDQAFEAFLQKLNYAYVEETENHVYKRFLRG